MQLLVNIDVDDLGKAVDFYCQALGLKVGRCFGRSGMELLGASSAIFVLEKPQGSIPAPTLKQGRSYSRHWTPVHLDFVVQDIDAAVRQALHAGACLESATATHQWGRIAILVDPFGNGFCLLQFLGRGYDEIADG